MSIRGNLTLFISVTTQIVTLGLVSGLYVNSPSEPHHSQTSYQTGYRANNQGHGLNSASGNPAPVNPSELKEMLREVLREELNTLNIESQAPTIAVSQKRLTQEEFYRQEAAGTVAMSIVEQAISAGKWTSANTEDLLHHLGNLSEQQRLKLLDQYTTALNNQQLDLEDVPPL